MGAKPEAIYTIEALAAEAGVTPRTVRYYIERRLIPRALRPTTGRTYRPVYTDEHLRAIRRVRLIRESNMSLADIRDRLYPEEDE